MKEVHLAGREVVLGAHDRELLVASGTRNRLRFTFEARHGVHNIGTHGIGGQGGSVLFATSLQQGFDGGCEGIEERGEVGGTHVPRRGKALQAPPHRPAARVPKNHEQRSIQVLHRVLERPELRGLRDALAT